MPVSTLGLPEPAWWVDQPRLPWPPCLCPVPATGAAAQAQAGPPVSASISTPGLTCAGNLLLSGRDPLWRPGLICILPFYMYSFPYIWQVAVQGYLEWGCVLSCLHAEQCWETQEKAKAGERRKMQQDGAKWAFPEQVPGQRFRKQDRKLYGRCVLSLKHQI